MINPDLLDGIKLPRRLRICDDCGAPRGWSGSKKAWCLCEGAFACRSCGRWRVQPGSDYYGPDGRWWHVPYFGQMIPCRACRGLVKPPDLEHVDRTGETEATSTAPHVRPS